MTRQRRADVGADVYTRVDATSIAGGELSDASDNGERRQPRGSGWYHWLEETFANTLVPILAREVVGVGRRRAFGGGEASVLSDGRVGDAPEQRRGPRGCYGDEGVEDELHGGRASTVVTKSRF